MQLTDIETTRLTKVCTQAGITLAEAEARFGDLPYGTIMARLITERDRAALTARSPEAPTVPQLRLLDAFGKFAVRLGNTALATQVTALVENFDATYGKVSHALDICQVRLGALPADLVPKYERKSDSSTSTSPANAIDVSTLVLPEEAV